MILLHCVMLIAALMKLGIQKHARLTRKHVGKRYGFDPDKWFFQDRREIDSGKGGDP